MRVLIMRSGEAAFPHDPTSKPDFDTCKNYNIGNTGRKRIKPVVAVKKLMCNLL